MFVQHPPTQLGTPVRAIEEETPSSIAVSDKGELFVAEQWDYQDAVLDAQGQRVLAIRSEGEPPFDNERPSGIATDGKGSVYVSGIGLWSATTNQLSNFTVHTYDTHSQSTPVSAELKSLVDGSVL